VKIIALTLFPEMFPGPLGHSLAGKALADGIWSLEALQIRDFATDKHQTVDDTPYGGGAGMVMRPDVLDAAIQRAQCLVPGASLVYFTPRGTPLTQQLLHDLSQGPKHETRGTNDLILLCGRYEGVDERILEKYRPLEVSIGDYVLSGGEIAAFVLMDALVRLLPGVMGATESAHEESFGLGSDYAGLLEYPHYCKPPNWEGYSVPEVLMSGHHQRIRDWRKAEAEKATKERRPDLWEKYIKTGRKP